MRTTISLDDRLAAQLRHAAADKGVNLSTFIAATLDDVIKRRTPSALAKPFRLITVGGDGPRLGIDIDRPRAIETADDGAGFRHLGL